ncbi:hypothetical protein Tco_0271615 [Tanacetum coccineum]
MDDVARAHGGDGGGEDPSRPPPTSFGCTGCFINRGNKESESPIWARESRRKDPGKDPEPSINGCGGANKSRPSRSGDPETGAYDLDRIRRGKPDEYTDDEWEKYINFWNDPANAQRAETIG